MATTVHQVDPKGDVLLIFNSGGTVSHQHQQRELTPSTAADTTHHPTPEPSSGRDETTASPYPPPGRQQSGPKPADSFNLIVSSSVLCLASPVFAAMFSSPMSEGLAFRAPGSVRPFPLYLPEDDGAVFTILANVLHHRADAIPHLPPTATLLALASLVDKYACAPAVMPYGVLWLQRSQEFHDGAANFKNQCNLLLFAYALDLPREFAHLGWEILLHHQQYVRYEIEYGLELPIDGKHDLLRHDLHGEFARRKARLRRDLVAIFMEPITAVTSHLTPPGTSSTASASDRDSPYTRSMTSTCPNAAMAIGNYVALLDAYNLAPWRLQYETDAFSNIITRGLEVASEARDNPALFFDMCSRGRCACANMAFGESVQMAKQLEQRLAGALNWPLWVCLDCLKGQGRGSDGGDNCRIKHW